MGVAGQIDVVGKQKLEGRLADEILVLRVELFVDDGDAAAVSYDLQARRIGEFKSHAPRTSQAELSFGATSVGPDLYEGGAQPPGRVEPGVGALNGFFRWNRRWSALRRFGRLFRRHGRRGQIKRRLLRESGGACGNGAQKPKRWPSEASRQEVRSFRLSIEAPNQRSERRISGKPRLSASTALFVWRARDPHRVIGHQ